MKYIVHQTHCGIFIVEIRSKGESYFHRCFSDEELEEFTKELDLEIAKLESDLVNTKSESGEDNV